MVPEGWDVLPLGEMADFRNGLNFTKGDDGEPIKIITIPDFWQRTELRDLSNIKSIQPKKKVPKSSLLASGDMLFVRSNGNPELVGRCLFFPEIMEPVSFSGFTIRGRVDQSELVPEFAAYVMLTERTKAQFRRGRGGGNISNLSQDILAGVQVALPPLPEQRKIADILSTWDQTIEKTEALLSNARTQKRALMQQLLTGKRRFPAFEGQPWKEVRLGDVADIRIGGTPARKEPSYWGGGKNTWLSIADLGPKHLVTSKECITDAGVAKSNVKLLPTGSVVMSFKLTIGKLGITGAPLYTNEAICGFVPKHADSFVPEFLYQLLHVADLLQDVDQAVKGKTLNKAKINELMLRMPSISEQQKIADVLASLDLELERNGDQVTKLRTEKKALMQQLLTGKRRVVV